MHNGHPGLIGGTTILFEFERDYICSNVIDINCDFIQSNRFKYNWMNFIRIIYKIYTHPFLYKRIILNINSNSIYLLIFFIFWKKRLIVRSFGGNLHGILNSNIYHRIVSRILFKNILITCVETLASKSILEKKFGLTNLIHFPNHRPTKSEKICKKYNEKIVFLGRIHSDKGIDFYLRLIDELSSSYIFDIYGPIDDEKYNFLNQISNYKGLVLPSQVSSRLSLYSVLIVPTAYIHEGYPGVIIEAMFSGVLVIASNYGAISEIIDDEVNGLLFDSNDFDMLKQKLLSLNSEKFNNLTHAAYVKAKSFYQTDEVINKFFDLI